MSYTDYKRDLAVRILRKIGQPIIVTDHDITTVMEALDEFLPTDDSPNRGHTHMVDLVCVYEVDCPECDASPEYTDVHPFCPECGYNLH